MLQARFQVLIEWPLAENAVKAGELAKAAKETGGKTLVGLQVGPSHAKIQSSMRVG